MYPEKYERCDSCRGSGRQTGVRGACSSIPDAACPYCDGSGSKRRSVAYTLRHIRDRFPSTGASDSAVQRSKTEISADIERNRLRALSLRNEIAERIARAGIDPFFGGVPLSFVLEGCFPLTTPKRLDELLRPYSETLKSSAFMSTDWPGRYRQLAPVAQLIDELANICFCVEADQDSLKGKR